MTTPAPPILHILAGPNGAGKSSLYNATVKRLTAAEFVNPDLLVFAELGRHAQTIADAKLGQTLAEARRAALMAAGKSLVTESTFSHKSKIELVEEALGRNYQVLIYHVCVDSADLAVARVDGRKKNGGHPVPEKNIRGRYARNGAIIREAILLATRGFVFDNSVLSEPPRRLMTFEAGKATKIVEDLPDWARRTYHLDLALARGTGGK